MSRARANRIIPAALVSALLLVGAVSCGTDGEVDSAGQDPSVSDGGVGSTNDTRPADTEPTDDTEPNDDAEPTDDTDPGELPEACDLLSEADAAAAFGEPVEPGETNSAFECWWSSENDLKTVNLKLSEPDLEEWRSGLDNDSWEPVDLGDEGYRGVGVFDTVEFRVGDRVIEINVVFSTSGDPEAVLDELAEAAASRS